MAETEKSATSKQEEAAPVTPRRRPSNIERMVEGKEIEKVQAETQAKYGFRISSHLAAGIIGLMDRKLTALPKLVASKDPATVRNEIQSAYGDDVTEQYAADLIAFTEKLLANNG